jgi:hypothetical protein
MNLINQAKFYIKECQIIQTSNKIWQVGKHIVTHQVKSGRSILTCTCTNYQKFVNESICSHRIAVILNEANKNLYYLIEKTLNQYKKYKENNLPVNHLLVLSDLENIEKVLC